MFVSSLLCALKKKTIKVLSSSLVLSSLSVAFKVEIKCLYKMLSQKNVRKLCKLKCFDRGKRHKDSQVITKKWQIVNVVV